MAKVSIIVPVYGVEKYIERCASSLFAQTMQDLEFIFVDDCSPDRSIGLLEDCMTRHPARKDQVRIIRLEKNGGVDNARRNGCLASTGEYVMFVDSDDFLEARAVESLLSKAEETGADMTICRFNLVYPDGSVQLSPLKDDISDRDAYLGNVISMIGTKASPNIFNKLFKSSLLKKIEVVPVADIAEDWLICVQAVHKADRLAFLDEALYNYVQRDGSATHSIGIEASRAIAKADMANIDLVCAYLESKGLAHRFRNEIDARKLVAKGSFFQFCDIPEHHHEWKDVYKEINGRILFNPCLSIHNRKSFILCWFGLNSRYYSLTGALKRFLDRSWRP